MQMRGKADHLDHYLVVWRGPFGAWIADGHRLSKDFAIDLDKASAAALLIDADKLVRFAFDDLDDLARLPHRAPSAASLVFSQPHANDVAIRGIHRRASRDIDVASFIAALGPLGPHESKAL